MKTTIARLIQFKNPGQGPPQVVPVTYLAQISQQPYRWMFKTGWFFRYFIYANIVCLPLWVWIDRQVNSPAAVAAWAAKKQQDKHNEHLQHMWADITGWKNKKDD
ncbi:uncharacterized protein LOC128963435 [Oppia nitens]|uniref:uncharacterized protein LOC128963435 n=1 Tax=Oppia nitens TaxID=1686743 RepID=UPI0023DC5F26|nr:uncharacterized protein LOC128963435 [Oppia nitens]